MSFPKSGVVLNSGHSIHVSLFFGKCSQINKWMDTFQHKIGIFMHKKGAATPAEDLSAFATAPHVQR